MTAPTTPACPICAAVATAQPAPPYWECPKCAAWFQSPMPPKTYQAPNEYDLEAMPEHDRQCNVALAAWLFANPMKGTPGRTLDIGSKHPVLASALAARGCVAYAVDAVQPTDEPGVIASTADFETEPAEAFGKFRLVTLIHVFEHLYNPRAALLKLRELVEDDGRLFLRIPDHRVPGYERDLTPHHYTIHPFFHALTSILELCAQAGSAFVVEWTDASGPGQRDVVLRPIRRRPVIGVAMIVKNEARDLPRCLHSLAGVADSFAIVDTGSTDETLAIARAAPVAPVVEVYLGASERDESGDWKLWDFSKARNRSLEIAEAQAVDWVLWADADDEILTPAAIRRAVYWEQFDVFGIWIDGGAGPRWIQQRLWKASHRVRFLGRCHEFPVLDGMNGGQIDDGLVFHHGAPSDGQENSNPRNVRLMAREWAEAPNPRTAFYMANTHRDGGRAAEAAEWYQRRLDFGVGFRDEYLLARLYLARCLRATGQHDDADAVSLESLRLAPDWAEFRMELANGAYLRKDYAAAIAHCARVDLSAPIPPTPLWREHSQYRDQPARLASWCHEHEGRWPEALALAEVAATMIGNDAEWDARVIRLRDAVANMGAAPAFVTGARRMIALCRPGAIGDILMTLNLLPALREANPDADVHYFCAAAYANPHALGMTIVGAGADLVMDYGSLKAWRRRYDSVVELVGYPLAEGYPEKPMARHLLHYFAAEMGLTVGDALPALTLRRPDRPRMAPKCDYVTLQVRAGWSHYKEWPADRWAGVVRALAPHIAIAQLMEPGADVIPGAIPIVGTLSDMVATFANARFHLGIDSFANHLTNYFWTDQFGGRRVPGVILWGSTQPSAAGYPDNDNLYTHPECGPCFRENPAISQMARGPCVNPPDNWERLRKYGDGLHACMANIPTDSVTEAAMRMLHETGHALAGL